MVVAVVVHGQGGGGVQFTVRFWGEGEHRFCHHLCGCRPLSEMSADGQAGLLQGRAGSEFRESTTWHCVLQ